MLYENICPSHLEQCEKRCIPVKMLPITSVLFCEYYVGVMVMTALPTSTYANARNGSMQLLPVNITVQVKKKQGQSTKD